MSTFEASSDYATAPFLADDPHAPSASSVEQLSQPGYVQTALQIADVVRRHGDAVENTTNAPRLKSIGLAVATGYEVSHLMSPVAESYNSLPNMFGLAAGYLAMKAIDQHYAHKRDRVHTQVDLQRMLAVQAGEELEFFGEPKRTLTIRWYGAHGDVSQGRPFAERADTVAEIVAETAAQKVHVSPELAELLGVDSEAYTEYAWALRAKQIMAPLDPRNLKVVSMSAEEFLEKAHDLFDQQPVISDTALLQQCLDYICKQKPDAKFAKLYGANLDLENPAQIKLLTKTLGQQVQALLGDVDAVKIDHTTTKVYSHGVLAPTTLRTASNPAINWYGDGTFRGSERLLQFVGSDTEALKAVMFDHAAPKDKYQAALILAYIESQKAAKGINVTPLVEDQHEGEPQPVFQGNLLPFGAERDHGRAEDNDVIIAKISPRRTGKLVLKALLLVGALNVAMHGASDSKGAIGPNAVITPVDNIISFVPHWANQKLDELSPGTARVVSEGSTYNESHRIGFDGSSGEGKANAPLWYIQSSGNVSSSGYWLTSTNHTMDLRNDWYGWYAARPNEAQPENIRTNPGETGFDENNPFPDGKGLTIHRTIELTALDNGSLYLPIQAHSNLLRVKMTDEGSGKDFWPDMYQQVDGPIFIRPDDHMNIWSMPSTSKLKVTYWLAPGGEDGVGRAIDSINVVGSISGLRDVDEGSLDKVWSETIPDVTTDSASAFLSHKNYSLSANGNQKYATETDLLRSILSDGGADCNRANTALVLSDPRELNLAGGFYNDKPDGEIDALSTHERHGYTVDRQGRIFDATPHTSTGGQQVADYFKENYKYAITKEEIKSDADRMAKVMFGLMGLMVLLGAGSYASDAARARHRKKVFDKIDDQAAQEARDVLDHMLYGGDNLFVPSPTIKSKQQTMRDIRQICKPRLTRKQIRAYDRRQNAVPKSAIKRARFLAKY